MNRGLYMDERTMATGEADGPLSVALANMVAAALPEGA